MCESHRAVFLDRDGVLNRPVVRSGVPFPPATVEELEILDGVQDACASLRGEGFLLIVVTNQPDVARGTTTMSAISVIHDALTDKVALDAVLVCPHDDEDGCQCRKPAPGLLLAAADRWDIDLVRSLMVGDRWKDIEAGQRAGCRTVFVDGGYTERQPEGQDITVTSLAAAVPWIIAAHRREGEATR